MSINSLDPLSSVNRPSTIDVSQGAPTTGALPVQQEMSMDELFGLFDASDLQPEVTIQIPEDVAATANLAPAQTGEAQGSVATLAVLANSNPPEAATAQTSAPVHTQPVATTGHNQGNVQAKKEGLKAFVQEHIMSISSNPTAPADGKAYASKTVLAISSNLDKLKGIGMSPEEIDDFQKSMSSVFKGVNENAVHEDMEGIAHDFINEFFTAPPTFSASPATGSQAVTTSNSHQVIKDGLSTFIQDKVMKQLGSDNATVIDGNSYATKADELITANKNDLVSLGISPQEIQGFQSYLVDVFRSVNENATHGDMVDIAKTLANDFIPQTAASSTSAQVSTTSDTTSTTATSRTPQEPEIDRSRYFANTDKEILKDLLKEAISNPGRLSLQGKIGFFLRESNLPQLKALGIFETKEELNYFNEVLNGFWGSIKTSTETSEAFPLVDQFIEKFISPNGPNAAISDRVFLGTDTDSGGRRALAISRQEFEEKRAEYFEQQLLMLIKPAIQKEINEDKLENTKENDSTFISSTQILIDSQRDSRSHDANKERLKNVDAQLEESQKERVKKAAEQAERRIELNKLKRKFLEEISENLKEQK